MTANAIDEALRNYVAVGGNIDHVAGLDNFCWCDPVKSDKTPDGEYKAAQLVRSNQASTSTARLLPLISRLDEEHYQIARRKSPADPPFSVTQDRRRHRPIWIRGRRSVHLPGDPQ
jgi:phosphoribosylformylglycinamidine synthase